MTYEDLDPFAGGSKTPSLSFKDSPIGTTISGTVTEAPKLVQSRDFETGEPAVWKNKDGSTSAKMAAVTQLDVNGELLAVWATKPSAMFAAIQDAQAKAGRRIAPGDTLAITYSGDKPNDNPRLNAAKQYTAVITGADAFAGEPAATHNQQPYTPPAAAPAESAQPAPGDFAAKAVQIKGLAAAGLDANQIAAVPGIGVNAGTIQAILNAA